VLWLVTATIGDAPIAILACAGLLLGVWVMARGRRSEAGAAVASNASPSPTAPGDSVAAPALDDAPPAPAVGHGPIRFVTHPEGDRAVEPGQAAEPEPPREPPPPPLPEVAPTTFRQGGIRVGGLERGRRRDGS
jgi:hypothetical protein